MSADDAARAAAARHAARGKAPVGGVSESATSSVARTEPEFPRSALPERPLPSPVAPPRGGAGPAGPGPLGDAGPETTPGGSVSSSRSPLEIEAENAASGAPLADLFDGEDTVFDTEPGDPPDADPGRPANAAEDLFAGQDESAGHDPAEAAPAEQAAVAAARAGAEAAPGNAASLPEAPVAEVPGTPPEPRTPTPSRVRGKVPIGTVQVEAEVEVDAEPPAAANAPSRRGRWLAFGIGGIVLLCGGLLTGAWALGPRLVAAFGVVDPQPTSMVMPSPEPTPLLEETPVEGNVATPAGTAVAESTPEPTPDVEIPPATPERTAVAIRSTPRPRATPKPKTTRVSVQDLEFLTTKGDALFAERKYPAARQQYRKVIALDATYAPARFGLARTLEMTGDRKGACREYRKYLSLAPAGKGASFAAKRAATCP